MGFVNGCLQHDARLGNLRDDPRHEGVRRANPNHIYMPQYRDGSWDRAHACFVARSLASRSAVRFFLRPWMPSSRGLISRQPSSCS